MKIIVKTPLTELDYSFLLMMITDHQNNKLVPGAVPDAIEPEQTVSEKLTAQLSNAEPTTAIDDGQLDDGQLDGPLVQSAPEVAPVNVELDNNGIPWDARIHSTSKAKTAEGNWRKLRNLEPSVFDLVMCELELNREDKKKVAPPPPNLAALLPADIAPPPVAIAPPPPPSAPAVNAPTFPEFIGKIGAAMSARTLTTDIINAAIVAVGFSTVADIAKNPDMIPLVLSTLQAQGYVI